MKYRWLRRRALWWTDPLGRDEGLGMRLRSKIFLASALVIVVLAGVSALSLGAVGRLVSVNREITTRAIPALSLTASAREAIPPLLGLEARAVVLGDRRYATAWTELAARIAEDLERLETFPARWVMEDPRHRPYFVFWTTREGELSYRVLMLKIAFNDFRMRI